MGFCRVEGSAALSTALDVALAASSAASRARISRHRLFPLRGFSEMDDPAILSYWLMISRRRLLLRLILLAALMGRVEMIGGCDN